MPDMPNIPWLKNGDHVPQGEPGKKVEYILDEINLAKESILESAKAKEELKKIEGQITAFLGDRSPKDFDLTMPTLKDSLSFADKSATDTLIDINNLYKRISENPFDLCDSLCDYLLATSRTPEERYVARELMLRHCQVSGGEPEQITSAIKLAECMAKLCESLTQQEFTDMVLDVHEATKKPWLWLALLDNMVSGDIKKTNNEFLILALAHNLESDPIKSHPDIQRRIARLSHRRDENTKAILAGLRKETPTDNAATDGFDPPPLTMDDF